MMGHHQCVHGLDCFLCNEVQSILKNGSVNAHNNAKQRWQFCAFSTEALPGAVPFELDFGYRIGLWVTLSFHFYYYIFL